MQLWTSGCDHDSTALEANTSSLGHQDGQREGPQYCTLRSTRTGVEDYKKKKLNDEKGRRRRGEETEGGGVLSPPSSNEILWQGRGGGGGRKKERERERAGGGGGGGGKLFFSKSKSVKWGKGRGGGGDEQTKVYLDFKERTLRLNTIHNFKLLSWSLMYKTWNDEYMLLSTQLPMSTQSNNNYSKTQYIAWFATQTAL